jgi:N-methylhydantoinase B
MVSKITDLHLKAGKRVRLETPGGGGWGPPVERATDAVAHDVALGFVSTAQAREIYKVAIAADGTIDQAATSALRKGAAA